MLNVFKNKFSQIHKQSKEAKELLRFIGPGILVTVGFIDPGNWAANLAAGADYGYALLWVVTLSTLMLILLQHNVAHLGIVTGECLSEAATRFLPKRISRPILVTAIMAAQATALAEILGAAIALNMLFGIPIMAGAVITAVVCTLMLWTNSYSRLETWIAGFVSVIAMSYLFEISMVHVDWPQAVVSWTVPNIPAGSMLVVMSILGAVIMPHNLFLHSEIIQSRHWNLEDKALMEKQNVTINENSIFDIQIKRLHEYKRQQLNALYVIHKYLEIKAGKKPSTPITVIFGAKAAPAYIIAQDIIHLILCLQQLINNDPEVSPYLNVVMVENYNVTWAEKLIPACDISEQISLASKEASGTGNMKFMLNGALTLGTEDGANVEIHELVGDDNIYIFGDSSDTVVERYAQGSYHAAKYYNENAAIKEAVDFITGEELKAIGDKDRLERLFNELVSKDWFMTFPDFDEYVKTREQAYADYENREEWVQKMLVNIAKAGYFSSDRTIEEYNRDIWKLED